VAESLLARTATGASIPGLEVAWHCIRARRAEEATPFLMTGAREAIMHGAPDEAARALSSALSQLKGRARDEATVLLAETYQEMARWEEALHYLRQLDLRSDPQQEQVAEILRIESERQLHSFEVSELEDLVRALISRIRGDLSPTVRARAALVASYIVCDLRNQSVFEEAWAAVHELTIDHFSTWDRGKVLLAKARTTYHMRRQDSGLQEAMETADLLEEAGATDSTFVRTHTGFGAIACAQGRYHEGLGPLERAYGAACRLDNPLLMCQAAYNRAVCLSRIGDPEEHHSWAMLAREASQVLAPGTYERAAAATQVALASLSLQSYGPVEEALDFLDAETRCGRNPWILQSTELFKADLNWLLGRRKIALAAVRKARTISGQALDIGFVGTFARWGTLLHMKEGNAVKAWEELRQPYELLPRLDAKDRADILCSIFTLGSHTPVPVPDIVSQAREALASLPERCAQEMISLGLRLPS
jgi:tetratricopeptide (TPR) repeat protein